MSLSATHVHSQDRIQVPLLYVGGESLRWGTPGEHIVIKYTYAQSPAPFVNGISFENCSETKQLDDLLAHAGIAFSSFHESVVKALLSWEAVTRVGFVYVEESEEADLRIGLQVKPQGIAFANLHIAPSTNSGYRVIKNAIVCLNPNRNWSTEFSSNDYAPSVESVMQHEIGHILGLDHPGSVGARMGWRNTGSTELTASDIDAVQKLYGAR